MLPVKLSDATTRPPPGTVRPDEGVSMHPTLIRILKHGLPAAAVLAVVGLLMADVAGMWVASQPGNRTTTPRVRADNPGEPAEARTIDPGQEMAASLRRRLPFTMAAWGFGIVLVYELLLSLWRGGRTAPPRALPPVPSEDEVEKLLNQLLQQAEAAEAARATRPQASTETPPPSKTPTPSPSPSEISLNDK